MPGGRKKGCEGPGLAEVGRAAGCLITGRVEDNYSL